MYLFASRLEIALSRWHLISHDILSIRTTRSPWCGPQSLGMTYKPFKPPLLVRRPSQALVNPSSTREAGEPPTKRRRVSNHDEEAHELSDSPPRSLQAVKAPRKPLLLVRNPAAAEAAAKPAGDGIEGYYTVLW